MDHIQPRRGRPTILTEEQQMLSPKEKQKIYYQRYKAKRQQISAHVNEPKWSNTEQDHLKMLRELGHIDY